MKSYVFYKVPGVKGRAGVIFKRKRFNTDAKFSMRGYIKVHEVQAKTKKKSAMRREKRLPVYLIENHAKIYTNKQSRFLLSLLFGT